MTPRVFGIMTDLSLRQSLSNQSPFDGIRRFDENGQECWYGRELMVLLGYQKWQRFEDSIVKAELALDNSGELKALHINHLPGAVKSSGRSGDNYKLSRHACHLIAMNGDPRKPEVAAAQKYFSFKTREAETVIPAQNIRVRELELELQIRQLDATLLTMHGSAYLALRGVGVADREVIVTELVEPATGRSQKILTAEQLKRAVKERTGQNLKSMNQFVTALRQAGRDDLLVPVTRHQTLEYIPPEKLDEAINVVFSANRQKLIGE